MHRNNTQNETEEEGEMIGIDEEHVVHHEHFMESPRKHVLMITNHGVHQWKVIPGLPDTGGQNVFVNEFSDELAAQGYKITIINRGGYPHPVTGGEHTGYRYKDDHQRIYYIEDSTKEFVRKEDMHEQIDELTTFLYDFLQDECPVDLINSHYWDAAKIGVELNKRLDEPIKHYWVPHSLGALKKHNVDPERWEPLRIDERIAVEKEIVKELDGVAATSSAIRESLKNDYDHDAKLFLPPCVDTDRIHPREVTEDDPVWEFLAQRCSLSPEQVRKAKIITEISRTDTTKRKDVLIKAFAEVQKEFHDSLLVVSVERDTPLGTELDHLARELGILGHVAFVGSVWALLPVIYAITWVYCTPSVMEGFGMSAQEAAATCVPVVSSDLVPFVEEFLLAEPVDEITVEGTDNPIREGQGAIMVKADDVPGFTGAICRLFQEEPLRHRMGRNAYEITIPYFSWKQMVSRFLEDVGV